MSDRVNYRREVADVMLRALANKSQRQLARDANVSQGTIGNMVMGRVQSRDMCIRVAQAAGIPPVELLRASGHDVPDSIEAVDLALRITDDLPETGKQQILSFVECIKRRYAENPNDPLDPAELVACIFPESDSYTRELEDYVAELTQKKKQSKSVT